MRKALAILLAVVSLYLSAVVLPAKAESLNDGYSETEETGQTEYADKIEADFEEGINNSVFSTGSGTQAANGKVTVTSDSFLETKSKMTYFLMYFSISDVKGGDIELSFGGSGENRYKIVFKKDSNTIELENLMSLTGELSAKLSAMSKSAEQRDINLFELGDKSATIKVVVIGDKVRLFAMKADEPYDFLAVPVAELKTANEGIVSAGNIGFTALNGASFSLDNLNIYSLMPDIEIETEDYVPEPDPTGGPDTKEPLLLLSTKEIVLIAGGTVVVLGLISALLIILRKKKKGASK